MSIKGYQQSIRIIIFNIFIVFCLSLSSYPYIAFRECTVQQSILRSQYIPVNVVVIDNVGQRLSSPSFARDRSITTVNLHSTKSATSSLLHTA